MRLPHVRDLTNADAAIVGAPFDTGATFRVGARFGPEAIRSASHLLRRHNPGLGVTIFDHLSVIDYGDVPVVPGFIRESYERRSEEHTSELQSRQYLVCRLLLEKKKH